MRLVLASGSPRRREILTNLGLDFDIRPPDIDESVWDGELPLDYVFRLAREKAAAVDGDLVIAADTTVDVDGLIIGKPSDGDDARRILRLLSGRTHHVHSAIAVRCGDRMASTATTSWVTFTSLDDTTIDWYVGTGEPFDKAGGYAIQGAGGVLVQSVQGSVSGVVGLPLAELIELFRSLGLDLLATG